MRHGKVDKIEDINMGERKILKYIFCIISILIVLLFYFNQHNLLMDRTNSIKHIHTLIYGLIVIIVTVLVSVVLKKNYKIEHLFLMVIIPIGIIYTLLFPPGIVPDEWTHMYTSFSLSSQIMQKESNNHVTVRNDEFELFSKQIQNPDDNYYNYIYTNIANLTNNNSYMNLDIDSVDLSQLFSYFPAVIGITIGRIFHMGAVSTVYLGRLCNFIFYIILTYQSIKKIPFGKLLLFAITMLPMTCHQMFSLSYDSVINAVSFFCIAYGMFFVYQSEMVNKKDIIMYSLSAILLLSIKGSAYAFILVIPILAKYFNPNGNEIAKRTKVVIFIIIVLCIIVLNFRSFINTGTSSSISTVSGDTIVPWSGTPSYSISSMLLNIPDTIMLFVHTIIERGAGYIKTAIGSQLGWLNIMVPIWIIRVWSIILFVSALGEKSNNEVFTYEHKLLYFLIAIGIIFVVMLAMALAWTPEGARCIEGVQGRYFIPIIFLFLIWLQNTKLYLREKMVHIMIICIPIMAIITIYNLIFLIL